jgi:hypothetical protein
MAAEITGNLEIECEKNDSLVKVGISRNYNIRFPEYENVSMMLYVEGIAKRWILLHYDPKKHVAINLSELRMLQLMVIDNCCNNEKLMHRMINLGAGGDFMTAINLTFLMYGRVIVFWEANYWSPKQKFSKKAEKNSNLSRKSGPNYELLDSKLSWCSA